MNTQPVLIRDGDIYSGYNFIGENIPIGAILPLMGLTAPTGYLICDGTTHLIEDYPDLTEFFKTQFGSSNFFGGDGVTTFKVPDLRGEFLRGTGTNGHANQGSGGTVGEHQDGTEHTNTYQWGSDFGIYTYGDYSADYGAFASKWDSVVKAETHFAHVQATKSTQTGTAAIGTSRPTNTSVTYIIKAFVSPATGDSGESKTPIRYSTEEQWTGKYWIDGKKIYQKTYTGTVGNISQGTDYLLETMANLDTFTNYELVWKKPSAGGYYQGCQAYISSKNYQSCFVDPNNNIYAQFSTDKATSSYIITIFYTKTTD